MLKITEQIYLRRPEPSDSEAMHQYRNDPEIAAALTQFSKGYSRNDLAEWVERQRKSSTDIVWAIVDANDNCIGHCGLSEINSRNGVAIVDICIGQSAFSGKGLGEAIIGSVLDYAFQQMNLRKVRAKVLSSNAIALGLLRKIGFESEGILREAKYRNGQYLDFHMLALFRRNWGQGEKPCPQN